MERKRCSYGLCMSVNCKLILNSVLMLFMYDSKSFLLDDVLLCLKGCFHKLFKCKPRKLNSQCFENRELENLNTIEEEKYQVYGFN